MKVGIIYIGHIKRAPYLSKYTKILESQKINYDIIYWNRGSSVPEATSHEKYKADCIYEYALSSKEKRHPVTKITDFLMFRKYVKAKIRAYKYEKLIILTTMSGLIIQDILLKEFKGKYIFDYRDASFEKYSLFNKIFLKLLKYSYVNFISSNGFREILSPKYSYIINHNINREELAKLKNNKINFIKKESLPLVVSFIGGLRQTDYMKNLIDAFKDQKELVLNFHGSGENLEELKDYCKEENNINFTGVYKEEDKVKLILASDILIYNYPSSYNNDVALANKYYDSLIFKKPLLGNSDTYSGKLILKNGLGVSLSLKSSDFANQLLKYYQKIDGNEFEKSVERELDSILKEESEFDSLVYGFIRS